MLEALKPLIIVTCDREAGGLYMDCENHTT